MTAVAPSIPIYCAGGQDYWSWNWWWGRKKWVLEETGERERKRWDGQWKGGRNI
jgi:hypothetical protein